MFTSGASKEQEKATNLPHSQSSLRAGHPRAHCNTWSEARPMESCPRQDHIQQARETTATVSDPPTYCKTDFSFIRNCARKLGNYLESSKEQEIVQSNSTCLNMIESISPIKEFLSTPRRFPNFCVYFLKTCGFATGRRHHHIHRILLETTTSAA